MADLEQLIETPNRIQEFGLSYLRAIDASKLSHSEKTKLHNSIRALENISQGSLKNSFQIIYNQLCVLSVSLLSATLEQHFINYANSNWQQVNTSAKKLEELKISLKYLIENNLKFGGKFGKLIIEKDNSIKFQDLNSTLRTYKEYFGLDIVLNDDVQKKIIFYQQVRHIIVHKGGIIDESFISATSYKRANIRNLKVGDKVNLEEEDWSNLKDTFPVMVEKLPTYVSS